MKRKGQRFRVFKWKLEKIDVCVGGFNCIGIGNGEI